MKIREYEDSDWPSVWPIVRDVSRARETYPYDPEMTEEQAKEIWLESSPGRTVVVLDDTGLLGTAKMGPQPIGPGSHIATASFMVSTTSRGKGAGRALAEHAVTWAREQGYAAMQFNAVVETNAVAVQLWKSLGFEVIGTVPEAHEHPRFGRVGAHVMYLRF